MGIKKRPASKKMEDLPHKKKGQKIQRPEEEESKEEAERVKKGLAMIQGAQEGEESEEEHEEDEESEEEHDEDEESEEEQEDDEEEDQEADKKKQITKKPTKYEKQLGKNTFAGNRAPQCKENLELFNLKKDEFYKQQMAFDASWPHLKKTNHKVNHPFKYWKHMQEAIKTVKKENPDATQGDYKKAFSEAAKGWKDKVTAGIKGLERTETW